MTLNPATPEFVKSLNIVGDGVISAPTAAYLEEPRGRFTGIAGCLARPRNTEQVATIIRMCNEARVGVVPYGGGTGLVSGQIMEHGPAPVLMSLERMDKIRDVDAADNIMIAEAGVILANIQSVAADANRLFPLSLASEGSCRIGGNLSTNAGGVNVLRYGNARDLCLGIEAVLPDGSILSGLERLRKNNTGYDLRHLLIGAEGTLGIITAAALKLFPRPVEVETAFVTVPNPQAALDLLNHLRDDLGELISAFELIDLNGILFMEETGVDHTYPLADKSKWQVLVECGAGVDARLKSRLEHALNRAIENDLILDATIAQNEAQRKALWMIRENIPIGNRKIGSISSHDISVPVSRVPAFIESARPLILAIDPDLRINSFGHLGDGNLHYNVFPPKGRDRNDYDNIAKLVKKTVHDLVAEFGGSFSAEHGVGRAKRADLQTYGDPAKLAAMRAIKASLDPNGIMNPGAVI